MEDLLPVTISEGNSKQQKILCNTSIIEIASVPFMITMSIATSKTVKQQQKSVTLIMKKIDVNFLKRRIRIGHFFRKLV